MDFDMEDDDDISSRISTGSLSPKQLRRLSRSPLSSKLHIKRDDYAIPIPFTLQLPPRLSHPESVQTPELKKPQVPTLPAEQRLPRNKEMPPIPGSPKRSKSPLRLVYTGQAYEPVDSSESEAETSYTRISPSDKPPAVSASRKKVARFNEQTQSIPSDQLSMIEETSSVGSSSVNSLYSRAEQHTATKELPQIPLQQPSPSNKKLSRKPPADLNIPPAALAHINTAPVVSSPSSSAIQRRNLSAPLNNIHPNPNPLAPIPTQPLRSHGHNRHSTSAIEMFPTTPEPVSPQQPSGIPHSQPCHHSLHLGEQPFLKIDKRSFSDESKVSSVSSFSSVGDIFGVDHADGRRTTQTTQLPTRTFSKHLAPPAVPTQRQISQTSFASSASADSSTSESSYNSIQQSVDLNTPDNASEWTLSSSHTDSLRSRESSVSTEDETQETIKPLQVRRKSASEVSTKTDRTPIRRVVTSEHGESLAEAESEQDGEEEDTLDNGGAGIGFSFPNNASNITNSEEARKRALQARQHVRVRSRRDVMSADGQIEIPNLDDEKISQLYHTKEARHNGVSFNDLNSMQNDTETEPEPIGVPGQAARDHLKSMYAPHGDSDSDSSFNSQFSKLNPSSQTSASAHNSFPTSKSLNTIASSRKSPIRHARHRSMYSIDVSSLSDPLDKPTSHLGHSKSKSIGSDMRTTQVNLARPSSRSNSPPCLKQNKGIDTDNALKIIVEEPPKKVEYAVDFKDATPQLQKANSSNEDPFASGYYNRSLSRLGSRRGGPKSTNSLSKSDTRSSQSGTNNSLATARETASTAPTDTNSITIDLTKEDYNLCMIKRHDSTLSYRSIIEKRNGKPVEVVLVDEDEENAREARDDLLSIYSRYMSGWDSQNSSFRSVLNGSEATNQSWAPSESNFQLKPKISARSALMEARQRNTTAPMKDAKSITPRASERRRRVRSTPPKTVDLNNRPLHNIIQQDAGDMNYFDYTSNEKYDFNTFMRQRAA